MSLNKAASHYRGFMVRSVALYNLSSRIIHTFLIQKKFPAHVLERQQAHLDRDVIKLQFKDQYGHHLRLSRFMLSKWPVFE